MWTDITPYFWSNIERDPSVCSVSGAHEESAIFLQFKCFPTASESYPQAR